MSNENTTIGQNGGVTRVQHGAPVEQATTTPAVSDSSRVSHGVSRMTLGEGGELTQQATTRYTVGQDGPVNSVMATLRSVNGMETVELVPGFPGSRTFIR